MQRLGHTDHGVLRNTTDCSLRHMDDTAQRQLSGYLLFGVPLDPKAPATALASLKRDTKSSVLHHVTGSREKTIPIYITVAEARCRGVSQPSPSSRSGAAKWGEPIGQPELDHDLVWVGCNPVAAPVGRSDTPRHPSSLPLLAPNMHGSDGRSTTIFCGARLLPFQAKASGNRQFLAR